MTATGWMYLSGTLYVLGIVVAEGYARAVALRDAETFGIEEEPSGVWLFCALWPIFAVLMVGAVWKARRLRKAGITAWDLASTELRKAEDLPLAGAEDDRPLRRGFVLFRWNDGSTSRVEPEEWQS